MTICSSTFANCILDTNRWRASSLSSNNISFFDTETIAVNKENFSFEVWEAWYFPAVSSCGLDFCNKKGIQTSEHYHFYLREYNYKDRTDTAKSILIRDNKGNLLGSYDYPVNLQKPYKLLPDTVGESAMLAAKNYIENQSDIKFPVVINNTKKEAVQRYFYQFLKGLLISPKSSGLAPILSEDEDGISIKLINKAEGISNEQSINIFFNQDGKDVLINGEATYTLRYPNGMIVGPIRKADDENNLLLYTYEVKMDLNGHYTFGFNFRENSEGYLTITDITPGRPFSKNGIKVGDVLISINGTPVKDYTDYALILKRILDPFSSNAASFIIKHNGENKQYTMKPKYIPPKEKQKEIME